MRFKKILATLNSENVIIYPTDTVWGIGCDATSEKAVSSIYNIKQRNESKALIVLVDSVEMLKQFVSVNLQTVDLIKNSNKPTTIIFSNPIGLAKNLINQFDNTVAIRVVKDSFCEALIGAFGKPIVSTSANLSSFPTPSCFSEIDHRILSKVDYIVNSQIEKIGIPPSRIVKIEGSNIIEIRS